MVVEAPPSRLTAHTAANDRMRRANSRRVMPTAVARRPSTVTNSAVPSPVRPIPVLGWRSPGSEPRAEATIRPSLINIGACPGGAEKYPFVPARAAVRSTAADTVAKGARSGPA